MRILFLAPQPFYQERGTPIAVRLALQVLADRFREVAHETGARNGAPEAEHAYIDLLTYHEGRNLEIPGVKIHRTPSLPGLKDIGPGASWKKLACDVLLLAKSFKMVWRARGDQYRLIHAVEESVFMAWLLKLCFGIPYIYDMDSSLSLQLTESWRWSRPLRPLLEWLERLAIRSSLAVVPVCDTLALLAASHGSPHTQILRDISLLRPEHERPPVDLRAEIGAARDDTLLVYTGNLESYQGIDLMIESFRHVHHEARAARLVVIGGREHHIAHYRNRATELGIADRTHFIGHKPLDLIDSYTVQADILVAPRIRGNNTPMKIYSYLHSGIAVVATNLTTHTQVLDASLAELREPDSHAFAEGMKALIASPEKRKELGRRAKEVAEREYTFEVFSRRLNDLYDRLDAQNGSAARHPRAEHHQSDCGRSAGLE